MLGLDQGTGSSRALLVDRRGRVGGLGVAPVGRRERAEGIDQDAEACWRSLRRAVRSLFDGCSVSPREVVGVGLAVQRSTSLLYGGEGPRPLAPAISWQCQRTAAWMQALPAKARRRLEADSGLPANPSYAASKLRWLDDALPRRGRPRDWRMGTLDSYLLARLGATGRPRTDLSHATRTLLVKLGDRDWSDDALERFGLPRRRLPPIVDTLDPGEVLRARALPPLPSGLPLLSLVGDQQAALFASPARDAGAKITYGSGAFFLAPAGTTIPSPTPGLLRSVAWSSAESVEYLLESNVPSSGTAFQWLHRLSGKPPQELLRLPRSGRWDLDLGELCLLPSFSGLGPACPTVDGGGAIFGLRHDVGPRSLALALAAGIAATLAEGVDRLATSRSAPRELVVDGGASEHRPFVQLQADVLQRPLRPTREREATAFGAAALAWRATGAPAPRLRTGHPVSPRIPPEAARALRDRFLAQLRRITPA